MSGRVRTSEIRSIVLLKTRGHSFPVGETNVASRYPVDSLGSVRILFANGDSLFQGRIPARK